VLELLQNIPHHAGAGREDLMPVGFAALEEASDHLHLAVVDGGVGLRGSLSLNPRYRGVSTAEALELILVEGVSRFDEPGRGGSLKRIREVALRNSGKFYVRSLDGVFFQEDVEWQVGSSFFFPGGPDLHPPPEKALPRRRTWGRMRGWPFRPRARNSFGIS